MTDLRVQLIIDAQNNSSGALQQTRNDVRGIDDQFTQLQTRLNQFIALKLAEVVTGWGASLVRTADNYQSLTAKLGLATDSIEEQVSVQKALFDIAQRTHAQLGLTEDVYIKNADAIKLMGGSTQTALTVTETLNKAIATTSQGLAQDSAAINQWGQALGKGALNGDELNSIMENSLGLTKALADGLGVPIGKLKELGEQGQLTGTDLINALISQQDQVDQVFKQIPITVAQSLTLVDNAWTQFIGQSNAAYGVTQTLASGFESLSQHIPELVEGSLQLAAIYGIKLTAALAGYIDAQLASAAASRVALAAAEQEAAVALALLRTETEASAVRVTEALATQELAIQRRALAVTTGEVALAEAELAAAERAVVAATDANIAANVALRATLNPVIAETRLATVAAKGLGAAFNIALAGWVGWEVGSFLRKLESVRLAGTYIAETFVLAATGVEALLNSDSFSARWEQVKKIHGDFSVIRQNETTEAIAATELAKQQSEQKTQLLEADKIAREVSFKTHQSQLKESSSLVEAEYARQNTAIKQALEARKVDILASALTELQKESLISQAQDEANAARLSAIQTAADAKLALLDKVYAAELAKLQAGTIEQQAVEKQSIEERIAVYSALEKNYSSIIDELIGDEQRHAQAAAQLLAERAGLERGTQDIIRSIRQAGLSDDKLKADQKKQLEENLSAQRKALAAGDVENARRYGEEAAKGAQQLATQAEAAFKAGKGYSSTAESFITKFKEARDGIAQAIDMERSAHQSQQQLLAGSIADTQTKLADTQRTLEGLTATLQNKFILKIDANTVDVDAAITRIQQPTESTHTIHVVEDRQGPIRQDGNSFDRAPPAHASGGFARKTGQLPGYGGGDQVKALLEAGEFVVRKEAVQALGGEPAMNEINAGRLPIRRASGGIVGFDLEEELKKLKQKREQETVDRVLNNQTLLGIDSVGGWTNVAANYSSWKILRELNRPELSQKVNDILKESDPDKASILRAHIFDEPKVPKLDAILPRPVAMPKLVPNIPQLPAPQAAPAAQQQTAPQLMQIRFVSPNGDSVSGQFNPADATSLLRILKDSGAITV